MRHLQIIGFLTSFFSPFMGHATVETKITGGGNVLLRVLIAEIPNAQKLQVTGSKLFIGSDDSKIAEEVTCEYHTGFATAMLWKNPLFESNEWYCKSATQTTKLGKGTYIHSHIKILSLNGQTFRGHLEILPTTKSLYVINHIPLDAYLASLTNSEMSASFPKEALRAQIIAARSYALSTALARRKQRWPFDLYNTQSDQVYQGLRFETPTSWKLVQETSRQVLNFQNSVLRAYYHSSSGGFLETPTNVWSQRQDQGDGAYVAKANPFDRNIKGGTWQIKLSRDLGQQVAASGAFREIRVLERTEGRRVKRLQIVGSKGQSEMSGVQFRNLFGPGWIKSAYFDVKKEGTGFVIDGRGWGHGVGMSQWGAKTMADAGKSAEQILKFYYPHANVSVYGGTRNLPSARPRSSLSAR